MHYDFFWKAKYKNGTELNQFNSDGIEKKYTDIDRSKLVCFELYKSDILTSTSRLIISVYIDENKRLIYRKRVSRKLFFNGVEKNTSNIYLIGWQKNVNGTNVQSIAYIFEDGYIELRGQWKENALECEPILLDCEKIFGDEK